MNTIPQCTSATMQDQISSMMMTEWMKKKKKRLSCNHPSMTREVKSKASLTKMYVKWTVKDEDFNDLFDLKHLLKTHRLALTIFPKNKGAFSKHTCDLGCSTNVEMDIPLLT
jgi:hypothetical protein